MIDDNLTSALEQPASWFVSGPARGRGTSDPVYIFQVDFLNRIKALVICVASHNLQFLSNCEALAKKTNMSTERFSAGPVSLHLGAVTAPPGALRHHGLGAAGGLGDVFLLLSLGADEQHHHDDDEHREEEPHQDADDQHEAVVTAVSVADLTGEDPFGEDLPLRARPPLGAGVQGDVQDVGAAVVAHADVLDNVRHVVGRPPDAPWTLWKPV